jgi:hypothetical protein
MASLGWNRRRTLHSDGWFTLLGLPSPGCVFGERMLERPHLRRNAERTFQCRAIPAAGVSGGGIGGGQEIEQQSVWVGGSTGHIVREDELPKGRVELGALCYRPVAEACRLRIGVGVEGGMREGVVAWPEPGAAHLVRVGLARNRVGQSGNVTRVERGRPSRETVTARSKLPQKKGTWLALPRNPLRKSLKARSTCTRVRQKR